MSLYPKGTNPVVRLPEVLAVGFTGHRKVPYEAKSRQVIRDFLARQKESHPGILYGISSAASGGDQLFAESCLELDIPLRILLPRPAEQFRADFDEASWQRTVRIVEKAISVELTGEPESQSDQYYDCGIQTVAESQLLMALWDGLPARGAGGTQEMVSYARKTGHPIAWIHSETGELQWLNKDALGHIDTSDELEFLNQLPDVGVALPSATSRDLAQAWLDKTDENANRFAPQARRVASIPIVYTAAAAVMSGVAPEIPSAAPWLAISAALGMVALALPAILRVHARQSLWARTRTAAEIARSVLVTWRTPRTYRGHWRGSRALARRHFALAQLPQDGRQSPHRNSAFRFQAGVSPRSRGSPDRVFFPPGAQGRASGAALRSGGMDLRHTGHVPRRRLSLRRIAMACQSRLFRPAMAGLPHVVLV